MHISSRVGLHVEQQRSGGSEVCETRNSGWPGWGKGGLKGGMKEGGHDPQVESDVDEAEESSVRNFLSKLDKNFLSSPRFIMRGEYEGISNGTVYKLIVRRKTEGTYVVWGLFNMKTKKQILLVRGEMNYLYNLERQRTERWKTYGRYVKGGWAWDGYGGDPQKQEDSTL